MHEANLPRYPDYPELAPSGRTIRELRTSLGLTQEAFAHAIAVTVSTVNRWENGHATPSRLAWKAIQNLVKQQRLNNPLPTSDSPTQGF